MSYAEALAQLASLQGFGVRLGLEGMEPLLERLGHPERRLNVFHIAGTNGKGSTAAFLDSILRQAGYKTGLYTSPHLCRFTERIRISGAEISESEVAEMIGALLACRGDATLFEVTTALAFKSFVDHGVDFALLETGLGGRLDATNVISAPLATVVTGVALDHTEVLGSTVEEIAREKAGIFKAGVPAVIACRDERAEAVLCEVAQRVGAPARLFGRDFFASSAPLGLAGSHQRVNAALAVEALAAAGLSIERRATERGLASARWPGRLELLAVDLLLDAAHNPEGARSLAEALPALSAGRAVTLVFGVVEGKDARGLLEPLLPLADRVIFTTPRSDRARDPRSLAALAGSLGRSDATVEPDLLRAVERARDGRCLVVAAGSLFLVGAVRALVTGEKTDPPGVQDPAAGASPGKSCSA